MRQLIAFLPWLGCLIVGQAAMIEPALQPNPAQRDMIARRYGMFIHFGINTYSGKEWTDGTLEPDLFRPARLDTDQWVRTAKQAGMTYVILTTKHHEGFCLWDSSATRYDVGSSPVATDVVRALSDSCRRHGIRLGMYYSLWDRNWNEGIMRAGKGNLSPEQSRAYVDYMKDQLAELLTAYGAVCELWLDGGWVLPREDWHIEEVVAHCKALQPDCLIGVNWSIGQFGEPDAHHVGPAEYQVGQPIRYYPSDFRLGDPMLPVFPDVKHFAGPDGRLHYLPFETTVCLNKRWFWQPDDTQVKTVEELLPLYEQATAQDNVLILNSPPNREGRMDERNINRLEELARALGADDGQPIPGNVAERAIAFADSVWTQEPGTWSAAGAIDGNPGTRWAAATATPSITLQWEQPQALDFIRVREYESRVQSFLLEAWLDGQWTPIHRGSTLGSNRVIAFAPIVTTTLRLRILDASAAPSLYHLAAGQRRLP